jgi:hypothetical protein
MAKAQRTHELFARASLLKPEHERPCRAPCALAAVAGLLLPACGFVGFDAHPLRDGGASEDSGLLDASLDAASMDAASITDASVDAGLDGGMDAASADAAQSLPDAGMDAGQAADASSSDAASVRDAGGDAALPDAGPLPNLDASIPLDASSNVNDAKVAPDGGSDAGMDAGNPSEPATQVSNYCLEIPALPDEPVIDGVIDAQLQLVTLTPVGWTSNAGAPLPSHTTASYALAFRPDGLYAFVRVIDPNRLPPPVDQQIWHGDGVELYVDNDGTYAGPNYDNPGTVQIIAVAPENAVDPAQRAVRFRNVANLGAWSSTRFAAFPTVDGYVVEAFVDAAALDLTSWTLATGNQVGMDLGVNVSAADSELDAGILVEGFRIGQYFLNTSSGTCSGRPYCNTQAFCNPVLID